LAFYSTLHILVFILALISSSAIIHFFFFSSVFFTREIFKKMYPAFILVLFAILLVDLALGARIFLGNYTLYKMLEMASLLMFIVAMAVVARNTLSIYVLVRVNAKLEAEVDEKTRALKQAYEELKTLDEMKGNILANVSHELRTPITIAKSAMELLLEEDDPDQRRRLAHMALNALHRQDSIVEDLIEAARSMKKEIRLQLDEVDVSKILNQIISEFKEQALRKGIELDYKVDNKLPKVRADPTRLGHVLRNLVDNAVKFTDHGRVTLEAKVKNGFMHICVSDTGIGIPRELHAKIFDPFYQVDSSTTRKHGGTGMGLLVAKQIVEAHGGKIWLENSEVKRGSRFCFSIPIGEK